MSAERRRRPPARRRTEKAGRGEHGSRELAGRIFEYFPEKFANPSHLFALDELLAVYPDALVVQTHRAPRAAIASACSLAAHATPGWSRTFAGDVIGRDQLELWARGLDHFMAARARHDPARFCDVGYDDFPADPAGPIESVYGHFGLALSGAAADAMRAVQAGSAPGGAAGTGGTAGSAGRTAVPAHQYALADFGLTGGQVDERFAGYLRSAHSTPRMA